MKLLNAVGQWLQGTLLITLLTFFLVFYFKMMELGLNNLIPDEPRIVGACSIAATLCIAMWTWLIANNETDIVSRGGK